MRKGQKPWGTVRDMQQIHCPGKDIERQPALMRDSETYEATTWDRRNSERQPATVGDSERHAATLLLRDTQ